MWRVHTRPQPGFKFDSPILWWYFKLKWLLLGGSWLVINRVISRVTILISHIRGLLTLLIATPEPSSRHTSSSTSGYLLSAGKNRMFLRFCLSLFGWTQAPGTAIDSLAPFGDTPEYRCVLADWKGLSKNSQSQTFEILGLRALSYPEPGLQNFTDVRWRFRS